MQKVLVISEIGLNWFGDISLAKEMIDLSKEAGADIVKFQMYRPKELLGENSPYLKDAEKGVLNKEQAIELKEYADNKGIEWCTSVFHPDLVKFTEELGVKRYKVASRSVKDSDLLREINKTRKPVIMSTGNASRVDIKTAAETFNGFRNLSNSKDITLLYCSCKYPTSLEDINLTELFWIRNYCFLNGRPFGFSSHCPKIAPSIAAVALGAEVVEHHVVKSKSMRGCDVSSSLNFKEFATLIKYIRELEKITV